MRFRLSIAAFVVSAAPLAAQAPVAPPIRPIGAVTATSTESFTNVSAVRQLPGGRVLVNEPSRRRVLMLDSALAAATVIADSTGATANAYSGRVGGLIPWKGDSTLFVDPAAMSMLVIEPSGKIGRVMSVPRSEDALALTNSPVAGGYYDGAGHLVYRGPNRFAPPPRAANGAMAMPVFPESAAVVRVDVATRAVDTLAFVRIPKIRMNMQQDSGGRITMSSLVNPLPLVDDWTVLSDGSVGVVRGQDYHLDIIRPDGSKASFPKMPFDWQRLSDEDKSAFIDSVKAQRARMGPVQVAGAGPNVQITMGGGPPGAGAAGGGQRVIMMGDGPPPRGAPGAAAGAAGAAATAPQLQFVAPSELPDYKPPFFAGSTRADADGNLWIRTIPTRKVPGGPVYDVVNGSGQLIDRVQVPEGSTVVGFGKGVAYLLVKDGDVNRLARAGVR